MPSRSTTQHMDASFPYGMCSCPACGTYTSFGSISSPPPPPSPRRQHVVLAPNMINANPPFTSTTTDVSIFGPNTSAPPPYEPPAYTRSECLMRKEIEFQLEGVKNRLSDIRASKIPRTEACRDPTPAMLGGFKREDHFGKRSDPGAIRAYRDTGREVERERRPDERERRVKDAVKVLTEKMVK